MIRVLFAFLVLIVLAVACSDGNVAMDCPECEPSNTNASSMAAATASTGGGIALLTDTQDFPPRWHCGTWTAAHGWTHIVADLLTWLAYMAIPASLLILLRRRRDVPFHGVFVLFSAFIVCCGMTHLLEALMFWWPAYRLMGLAKVVTAIVSLATVTVMIRITPKALLLRSPAQLEIEVQHRTAELERAREAAQVAAQARARFTANVSHEMRTPLTAVLGYADLLADDPSMTAGQREQLHVIQRNSTHLLAVINDVLDLSRGEAGMLTLVEETCCVDELVRDCVQMLSERARRRGLDLTSDVGTEPMSPVVADPVRLRQILINVLGNAIKFTENGTVHISARAMPVEGSGHLKFEVVVRDSGIGMTAEQAAHAFDEYTQGDASLTRRYGGSGLGLTISHRLAVAMGGSLEVVDTQPGRGTTLRLCFVAAPAQAAPEPTKEVAGADLGGLRVLLAEDAEDTRRLLKAVLTRAGAVVTLVDNGQDAVTTATRARGEGLPFDLILMDVQMPLLDGLSATRQLRAAGHAEKILALTAHAAEEDRLQSKAAGCDGHLTKPIRPTELVRSLAEACRPSAAAPAS